MKKKREAGYNERLFSGGFRGRLHGSRFLWLQSRLRNVQAQCGTVLELGCFDGRAISFLPRKPEAYLGLDANWEGGVDLGRATWRNDAGVRFEVCETPTQLREWVGDRRFDTTLCLETLEHVKPSLVASYVEEIAKVTTGHILVTVPNEKGPLFLAKYLVKRLFGDYFEYRPSELWWALIGRMDRVERNDHKGFDYETIIRLIGSRFDLVEVSGYPFPWLPKWANFGVGMVAKARSTRPQSA